MAGKRITELNSMTGAQVDPVADVLAIVDVDGQETKKISIDEIALAIGSGAVNVSLNLTNNLLELTDSNNNTVSADLSILDNSGLTLQDVTSNGAVTDQVVTFNNDFFVEQVRTRALNSSNYDNDLNISVKSTYNIIFKNNGGYEYLRFKAGSNDIAFKTVGQKISIGKTTPTVTLDINGTDAVQLTSGTTAERPTTPANGMIRYNSQDDVFEGYDGDWGSVALFQVSGIDTFIQSPNSSGYIAFTSANARVFSTNITEILSPAGLRATKAEFTGTDAVQLTSGTTAQRPTGNAGMIRFNTDTSKFEGFDGTTWIDLN